MGLVLLVILLPICIVAIYRRRRTQKSLAVPIGLIVYANVAAIWFLLTVIRLFVDLADLSDPSMKAMLLAKGISALMNTAVLGLIIHVPLLGSAYLIDRWLVARSTVT